MSSFLLLRITTTFFLAVKKGVLETPINFRNYSVCILNKYKHTYMAHFMPIKYLNIDNLCTFF